MHDDHCDDTDVVGNAGARGNDFKFTQFKFVRGQGIHQRIERRGINTFDVNADVVFTVCAAALKGSQTDKRKQRNEKL